MEVVTIECASWYQREDGFIQVLTVHGKTVILNEVFSKIWLIIEDEIRIDELIKKVGNSLSSEEIEQILSELMVAEMISVNDESNDFNTMFS